MLIGSTMPMTTRETLWNLAIYQDFLSALITTAPRWSTNNGPYMNKDVILYGLLAKIALDKKRDVPSFQ